MFGGEEFVASWANGVIFTLLYQLVDFLLVYYFYFCHVC